MVAGIRIIASKPDKAIQAKILAVGPESKFTVGDTVLCGPFAGDDLKKQFDGKWHQLKILLPDSVLAIL
jgi:co-chaperonin GroES (HSP10)